jgi:hypothetical protein
MQEDAMKLFLPWMDKKGVAQCHHKEPKYIHIIQREDEKSERIVKDTVHTKSPYDDNTPCYDFNEGTLVFMWEKRKGKPIYEYKDNNSWLVPYIIKNKSDKKKYYLTTLDGIKMPFPIDGFLLQPHIHVT